MEEEEEKIWNSLHNDFLAHQNAEHCIILRQFRGHFRKSTGCNHDKWTAALYSAMSGMEYSDRDVHDELKIVNDMELKGLETKCDVTIFCVRPKAKP